MQRFAFLESSSTTMSGEPTNDEEVVYVTPLYATRAGNYHNQTRRLLASQH
jgi:hypothetical protein